MEFPSISYVHGVRRWTNRSRAREREREKAPKPLPRATNGKRNKKVHIYRIARIYLGNAVAGCIECQQSPRNVQAWAIGCPIKTKPDIFCLLERHACIANRGYFPREMSAQLSNEFIFFFFPLQEGWRQTTNRCLSIKIHRAQGKPINFRVTNRNDYNYISEDSRLHHEYESPWIFVCKEYRTPITYSNYAVCLDVKPYEFNLPPCFHVLCAYELCRWDIWMFFACDSVFEILLEK